jgi:hypothetical protein
VRQAEEGTEEATAPRDLLSRDLFRDLNRPKENPKGRNPMPAIQVEVSVAANSANSNLFSGSAFEYSRGRNLLSLGVTAAATGTFVTINSGADVVLEESPAFVKTSFPIVPDEMYYNDIMEPFDRLRVSVRNPTGAAVIHRAIALLSPL